MISAFYSFKNKRQVWQKKECGHIKRRREKIREWVKYLHIIFNILREYFEHFIVVVRNTFFSRAISLVIYSNPGTLWRERCTTWIMAEYIFVIMEDTNIIFFRDLRFAWFCGLHDDNDDAVFVLMVWKEFLPLFLMARIERVILDGEDTKKYGDTLPMISATKHLKKTLTTKTMHCQICTFLSSIMSYHSACLRRQTFCSVW